MKLSLVSLGCAKNLVDSEMILSLMRKNDFILTTEVEEADVIIVNTCGFIDSSKQESINKIIELGQLNKILIVCGCLVKRYKEQLEKELPEVDLFISIDEYPIMAELIQKVIKNREFKGCLDLSERVLSTEPYTAYLKISDGCNNCCTYCAIPLIRGPFKSVEMKELIKQANIIKDQGVKELVVISQDTTRYGSDLDKSNGDIVSLLKELLKIKEFAYIRLLYLYPDEISDELIELIGKEERLTPYFDIPIQHASSKVLNAMNRRGDKVFLLNLFNKIKKKVPNAILRTTLIVGFPGETEEDFNELKEFVKEVKFNHLGTFTYSREEGTKSYDYENQVPEEIKIQRYNEIMKIQKHVSLIHNRKQVNKIHKGIVLDYDYPSDTYTLRSFWNSPDNIDGEIIFTSNKSLEEGQEVEVLITGYDHYNLYGELIEK
ncbi:MAG: 30S ribosomal protein S12 methylthiotransferase RimO [Erysipelotrichaceae bacterium]|nr:30S ribosomal protein S12 methylthiotransferase RimO [Erysipelotrichaceae bacterium]